ncbi:MAG TPA: DUF6111 family protein [Stellaceae bacterium]|jgi:hypothetical protein|nr:DUF6111 family protein [Stellaceae bacterium]
MLRVFATIVLPLLLPTALYLLWIRLAEQSGHGRPVRWTALPWVWLAGAGTVLLIAVLVFLNVRFGSTRQGVYVPPRYENGQVVPPHFEPKPNP